MSGPLAGRVALVTGASRGIGAAAAVELAWLGAHCVLTARTQGGLEETDDAIRAIGGRATLLPLDLLEFAQIDDLGPSIGMRFHRLDILIHCAGALGRLAPVAHLLAPEWDEAIGVNATAALRLIRTTDGLLRQSDAGRAVFVTTARARAPKAYWGCYGASKAALEHLVLSWADEVCTTTPMRVNLFDPGPVASRLRLAAFPGEVAASLPRPEEVAPALAALCLPSETRNGEVVGR